jgi:ABC-type multidrug transport system ATPase subunit
MEEIISARHLSKSYGSTKAVDELNLHLSPGEFYGFLGPNGAGKTTTIRLLTGIITPDDGEITVAGYPSTARESIAKIIGVIPEGRGFYEWMTADEYLHFFADLHGVGREQQDELITSLLAEVDLIKRRRSRIGAYSRGMKQRLGLARALINTPLLLFLDEPTLGLDPQGQEDIQRLLKQLNEKGVTIFLSSHLLDEVANLCTRVGIINYGTLIANGTLDELREQTHLKDKTLTDIFLHLTRS